MTILRGLRLVALGLLTLATVGPTLQLDRLILGECLVYLPRLPLTVVWVGWLAFSAWHRRWIRAALGASAIALTLHDSGLRTFTLPSDASHSLCLVTCNVGDDETAAPHVASLWRSVDADFSCLQEVRARSRAQFMATLPEYEFFFASAEGPRIHPDDVLDSNAILVHRRHLTASPAPRLHERITGYRSSALTLTVYGRALCIVNVHATKPIWRKSRVDLDTLRLGLSKLQRHREEGAALVSWLELSASTATIVAGDFNAPLHSSRLAPSSYRHAHLTVGTGFHFTWPASFPLLGLDHVLASDAIEFLASSTKTVTSSDHRAVVVRWSLSP